MSAAKVRVHNTSTSSIDAVVEPFYRKLEKIHIDSSKLQVTCNETFLEDVKVLKPIDGVIPPAAKDVLPYSPKQKIVVGVSGVSCGGKTTVASGLNNWLNKSEQNATLIMQDDFYKPASELPINSITNFPEFDEPESVRMDLIKDKILEWLDEPVELDQEDAQILIVEGTMIFTDPDICDLCDLRYLVHVDFEVAKYRRSLRNYKIPDPPEIVARNIWPKYIKHREIFRQLKNKYSFMCKQINGTVPVEQTIAGILLDVKVNQHR
jgi:uridine kinase